MSAHQKKPQFIHGQPSMGLPFQKELVVDLFAGGGGASTGIARAYREPDVAEKHNAIVKISTILSSAVSEELISKNPAAVLDLPKRSKKEIDPFSLEEANNIIATMYQHEHWPSTIYAVFFEFVFFTGMRLSEALALRWDAVDVEKRTAHVCRGIALGGVVERTKTGSDRFVLLNERALRALGFARQYADRRRRGKGKILKPPFIFPSSKNAEYVKQTSDLHGHAQHPPQAAVQLSSYLCDNMHYVWHEPRIHLPAARP